MQGVPYFSRADIIWDVLRHYKDIALNVDEMQMKNYGR